MNAKKLIAAIVILSAVGATASAQDATTSAPAKSRADVVAELQQARADGSLQSSEAGYPAMAANATSTSRADVVAELSAARADGSLNLHDATYPVAQQTGTPKTRQEVRAELSEYKHTHAQVTTNSLYTGG